MKIKLLLIFKLVLLLQACTMTKAEDNKEVVQIFPLNNYDQNINNYFSEHDSKYDESLVSNNIMEKKIESYKEHLFGRKSPWSEEFVVNFLNKKDSMGVYAVENFLFKKYRKNCDTATPESFSSNFKPYSCTWFDDKILLNMNLNQFNKKLKFNIHKRAIATSNLSARSFPTKEPLFFNYKQAGDGYPFDMLQVSSIWVGTPLYVVGKSRDKKWYLVLTNSGFVTWVPSNNVGFVSDEFIAKYNNNVEMYGLRTIIRPESPVTNSSKQVQFLAYTGSIFPAHQDNKSNKILIPIQLKNGYAKFDVAESSLNNISVFPLLPSTKNFVDIINPLLGRPYGWGGLYFYNDCSQELKSIFSVFGIWLPRNSATQYQQGRIVDLSNYSSLERVSTLAKHGRKFLTLVYVKGHIMLYIGNFQNTPWVYNNIWGLKPADNSYRSIIGQSSLIPLLDSYPENPSLMSISDESYAPTFIITYLDELLSIQNK